jgi:hypothetical protein
MFADCARVLAARRYSDALGFEPSHCYHYRVR